MIETIAAIKDLEAFQVVFYLDRVVYRGLFPRPAVGEKRGQPLFFFLGRAIYPQFFPRPGGGEGSDHLLLDFFHWDGLGAFDFQGLKEERAGGGGLSDGW
jgi:hypothetical protein